MVEIHIIYTSRLLNKFLIKRMWISIMVDKHDALIMGVVLPHPWFYGLSFFNIQIAHVKDVNFYPG